jgi:hypothetical protein
MNNNFEKSKHQLKKEGSEEIFHWSIKSTNGSRHFKKLSE